MQAYHKKKWLKTAKEFSRNLYFFFFEPAQNMNVIRMLFFFRVKRKKKREGKILTQVKGGGRKGCDQKEN